MGINSLPNGYYDLIKKYPILSAEREHELFAKKEDLSRKIKKSKSENQIKNLTAEFETVRHTIISSNLRLVVSIAKNFINRGMSIHDLIDEGTIGLIEATERFDYKRGFRFSTYATWWIRQIIIKALGDQGSSLRLPTYILHILKKQSLAYSDLAQQYGREPCLREISSHIHIGENRLREVIHVAQQATSLNEEHKESGKKIIDILIDEKHSHKTDTNIVNHFIFKSIHNLLNNLSPREIQVVKLRYGFGDSPQLTLEETCRVMGITRERVRQIQKKALDKLRVSAEIQDWKPR